MNKKYFKNFIILLVLILLIVAGIRIIKMKKLAMAQILPAKTYSMVVATNTAKSSDVQLTLPYLALVQSDTDVEITSKISSRIKMILPNGKKVSTGDILVELNDSDLMAKKQGLISQIKETESNIRAQQADLNNLRHTHERSESLLESNSIAIQQYDNETAQILSLKATIDSLNQKIEVIKQGIKGVDDTLSYTTLKSPINGVVSKAFSAVGSITSPGKPLLSISGQEGKYILVRTTQAMNPLALIYQQETCQLQPLHSTFNGLDEYSCHKAIDQATNSRIDIKLVIYKGEGILLPPNGVLHINNKTLVLLFDGNKAKAQPVNVIMQGSEGILVDGLPAGSEYIVAKPDILLKLLTGIAVKKTAIKKEG